MRLPPGISFLGADKADHFGIVDLLAAVEINALEEATEFVGV